MEPKNFFFGSKPKTYEQKITKMKEMFKEFQIEDKQLRRKQIAEIKQKKDDGLINTDDE